MKYVKPSIKSNDWLLGFIEGHCHLRGATLAREVRNCSRERLEKLFKRTYKESYEIRKTWNAK